MISLRFAIAFAVAFTAAGAAKRAKDLPQVAAGETRRVLVLYKEDGADDKTTFEKEEKRKRSKPGRTHRKFEHMPMASLEVTEAELQELENDEDVLAITPDRVVEGAAQSEINSAIKMWPAISDWYAANGDCRGCSNGKFVGVAIIDSGVSPHADFNWWNTTSSRVVYQQSFVDSTSNDLRGHGTHVAGLIAGEGNVSCLNGGLKADGNCRAFDTYFGVASGAQIVSLKVLDANGQGTDSAVVAAIDRAIALRTTYNIRVMNLSLGRPVRESYKTDPLCLAVERAWRAGIVVVVSAGNNGRDNTFNNNGYGTINSPGNDPLVITVGAVNTQGNYSDADDKVTTYSSRGPTVIDRIVKPDIVAPGNNIASQQAPSSTLAVQHPANRVQVNTYWPWTTGTPDKYFFLNGTSMAAPIVAGAAVLLIDRDSSLTPDMVKVRLMKSARRNFVKTTTTFEASTNKTYRIKHDIFTVGAGMLDMAKMWTLTDRPTGSAASPKAIYNSATKKVTLDYKATGGTNVVWGDTGAFASNVVWGDNVIIGTNVVWGDNVLWGDNVVWGDNVLWGSTSPFSASTAQSAALSIAINGDK